MSLSASEYSQALQDSIDYAYGEGSLLVASAGNCALGGQGCSTINPPEYPATNNHVMAVGATDDQDRRASFSNYGSYLSVTAPGVGIYSTHWQQGESTYFWMSGTSQAAPHVSGVAALVWSGRPGLSNQQVRQVLEGTSDDVNAGQFPGPDSFLGWGRINAWHAVDRTPPVSSVAPLPVTQRSQAFLVTWSALDDNSGISSYSVRYRDGAGPWRSWLSDVAQTESLFFGVQGHTYYFQSSAADRAGNVQAWRDGDGDTFTTITTCSVAGRVLDNRGIAVADALARGDGGSMSVTDDLGRYRLEPPSCNGVYGYSFRSRWLWSTAGAAGDADSRSGCLRCGCLPAAGR